MDEFNLQKIEQIIRDRKKFFPVFLNGAKAAPCLREMEEKTYADGALDRKTKELMALSIGIVTKCDPCMEWHIQQAYLAGASDQEIFETIDVAINMAGGAAMACARFALTALEYHKTHRR